jgi:hypothetical protein
LAAALLALAVFSAQVNAEALVRSESRAGQAPIVAGSESQTFVATLVRPVAQLELLQRGTILRLEYGPRIFWQDPRPIEASGPLILHTASASLESHAAPGVLFTAIATGSIGSPDYTALPQLLGTTQGTLPVIARLASGAGSGSAAIQLTARTQLDVLAHASAWRSLDAPDGGTTAVTSLTQAGLASGATYRVTALQRIGLHADVGGAWYSTGLRYLTVTPMANWDAPLTPVHTLRATLGAVYARPFLPPGALETRAASISPVGSVDLEARVSRWENVVLRVNGGAAVTYFFDPVLGSASPRGAIRAGASLAVAPDWTASLRGDFGTGPRLDAAPMADVTVFSVAASVRNALTRNLLVELGGMWADRAPAFGTPMFAFHQPQLWAFLAITATTRTATRGAP